MGELESVITEILGPSYNYADNVDDPSVMDVSGSGSVDSMWKNVGSIASYVDTLTFGTKTLSSPFDNAPSQNPLGNKFFIKSGKCDDTSTDECKDKTRYIYINNVPDGKIPCIDQLGIKLPATDFKGIVPGMLKNIGDINPIGIFNSLAGKGNISNKCSLRTEEVGSHGKYKQETRCAPENQPIQCLPAVFENFENKGHNQKWKYYFSVIVIIVLFIIVLSYLKKKKYKLFKLW